MSTSSPSRGLRRTSRLLGLASLGLGGALLGDPAGVARLTGVDDSPTAIGVLTAVGARELLVVPGLLAGRPRWSWLRVAGDAMDLAAMGIALRDRRGDRARRLRNATIAVGVLTGADVLTALASLRSRRGSATAISVSAATTINKPPQEVYAFWRDLEHLPLFMAHVREVRTSDGGRRSHWVAEAPVRGKVAWDAELVEDRPGSVLRWRSTGSADVDNEGVVEFAPAPGDRGTEVRVHLTYAQPGGRPGRVVAKLLGEAPDQQIRDDLTRFKQVLETGQVVRSEGSPEGPLARRLARQRTAVPVS
jgi:uncharacterized membrane protein